MACPSCGCKVHYQFDGWGDDANCCADDRMERCAACGAVFHIEDAADDEDDDEPQATASNSGASADTVGGDHA